MNMNRFRRVLCRMLECRREANPIETRNFKLTITKLREENDELKERASSLRGRIRELSDSLDSMKARTGEMKDKTAAHISKFQPPEPWPNVRASKVRESDDAITDKVLALEASVSAIGDLLSGLDKRVEHLEREGLFRKPMR